MDTEDTPILSTVEAAVKPSILKATGTFLEPSHRFANLKERLHLVRCARMPHHVSLKGSPSMTSAGC